MGQNWNLALQIRLLWQYLTDNIGQVRQRDRLRPQPRGAAAGGRGHGQRLHQRQLLRRIQEAECLHCNTGEEAVHILYILTSLHGL